MANPRATVGFTEILNYNVTFKRSVGGGAIDYLPTSGTPYPASTSTQTGFSASVSAAKTARVGASNDTILGKVIRSSADGMVEIQTHGFATYSYVNNATAPVLGRGVVCDGAGGVAIASAGTEWKERGVVVDMDTVALTATVLHR